MKNLLSIVLVGILLFSCNNNVTRDIVLEEFELNMVNLDYELELETVDLNFADNSFLQNQVSDVVVNKDNDKILCIELQIPNYKYLEELESVEFTV